MGKNLYEHSNAEDKKSPVEAGSCVTKKITDLLCRSLVLSKSFLGGKLGSGKQFFTWIHEEDFLNAALWTIKNELAIGAYNLTSPEPASNDEFMKALRNALGISFHFSLPEWLIKIGGKIIGTEPYLILDGRRIIPARLVDAGFEFQYSHIEQALNDLFKRDA